VHAGCVEEVGLQPLGRRLAEEDEAVEVDHRVEVDADPKGVGGAAGQVVGRKHDHHRQPVREQPRDLPRVAADRGAGEGPAGPGDDQLALNRDPVARAPGDERDEVGEEGAAAHRPPVLEAKAGRVLCGDLGEL